MIESMIKYVYMSLVTRKLQGFRKFWKTWKIKKKRSKHGKIMEFEKTWIIMEKSWNFMKSFDKTNSSQKTSCQTHSVWQLVFWLLVVLIISKCMHNLQAWLF